MYSSTAGSIPSLIIAGLVLIFSWIVLSNSAHYRESGVSGGSHAIGAGAASFAAAFSVINLALQWHVFSRNLVGQEIAHGVLALRVVSVTGALAFGFLMLVAMREPKFVVPMDLLSGDWDVDSKLFEEYRKRVGKWPVVAAVSQATVLSLILCLLWALQMLGRDSLAIALLNWSFAFISDVFFMAASYRAEKGVLPSRVDATLIRAWGVTTFALFCFVAFQQFAVWQACLIITLVTFFLLWSTLDRIRNRVLLRALSWLKGFGKGLGLEGEITGPDQEDSQ